MIGSGPAGAILTAELSQYGVKTLLVEGGSRPGTQEKPGYGMYPAQQTRFQGLGGTSNLWDGTCPRLLPIDFSDHHSNGVDGNHWPVSYNELMPYYLKAEKELRVYGMQDAYTAPRNHPYPISPPVDFKNTATFRVFNEAGISVVIEPKSGINGIRILNTHIPKIEDSPHSTILNNHKVVHIVSGPNGQITELKALNSNNNIISITAKNYVLACGGVEIPRLLLASRSRHWPNGIGNNYDNVGRYFHEHLWLPLSTASVDLDEQYASSLNKEGVIWQHTEQLKKEGLGDCYFECKISTPKQTNQKKYKATVRITAMLGMEPRATNRVVLDEDDLDPWGLPTALVNADLSTRDLSSIDRMSAISTQMLRQIGATSINTRDTRHGTSWTRWTHHHMGTCRMGNNSRTAVVDANLKVHGTRNLYIAGSACFVTPGANGPTLLLSALALRLADHLRQT